MKCPPALLNCRLLLAKSFARNLSSAPSPTPSLIAQADTVKSLMSGLDKAILNNDSNLIEKAISDFRNASLPSGSAKFINRAIEAYMRVSRTDQAKELFKTAVNDGFVPDDQTLIVLVDGYLRHGDSNRAKEVMKSMSVYGLKPTIRLMNLWMLHYLKEHQLSKARTIFDSLEAEGLSPNQTTYLNFIRYFIKNSDFSSAETVKEAMMEKGIRPAVSFYNAILQLYFQKQAITEVECVLLEMDSRKIRPNENTFNALVEGYASVNMLEKAQELIRQMSDYGIKPSIVTFNRLLASQAYALDVEQTRNILMQMNDFGLEFNAYTYAALFKGLVAKQKCQEAVAMLFRMEENKIALPIETFTDLVKLCCDNNIDSAVYLLRNQMIKYSVSTNSAVYTVLIKYYLRHRNYKEVDGLLLEMQRTRNLVPGLHIFATLLDHFVEHLHVAGIKSTLENMRNLKLELNKVIYSIVMKAFYVHCKCLDGGMIHRSELSLDGEQTELICLTDPVSKRTSVAKIKKDFEEMFGIPFQPSIHVFNDLMNNFFYSGRYIETIECYEEIIKCDLIPNLSTMTTLIKARIYLGQVDEARAVVKKIPNFGLKPTILQCALVHHALCREYRTDEAESFMQEIASIYHLRINYVFYASLIYAYHKSSDHYNVFRTFERLEAAGLKPDTEVCNYILISMIQTSQLQEADQLFNKMIALGIKRNSHTYSAIADRSMISADPDKILGYLDDSLSIGNTIDATPFNYLCKFFYDRSEMDRVSQVIDKMKACCVRYTWDTWQYVSYMFYRCIDSCENLAYARELLEKALVDLEGESSLDAQLIEAMRDAYEQVNDTEGFSSLEKFIERLPDLREKMTQISPTLREKISVQETKKIDSRRYRYVSVDKPLAQIDNDLQEAGRLSLYEELEQLAQHYAKKPKVGQPKLKVNSG